MSGNDRGQVLAGRLLMGCQFAGYAALSLGSIAFVEAVWEQDRGDVFIASGVFFLAAAVAFGLALNAVLRN